MASWPPKREPMAQGLPGSSGPGVSVLLGPLRFTSPIGEIGGRYTTSKPRAAIAGSRFVAVANVPERGGSRLAPSERGKNSYQAENSARSRSTVS